MDATRVMLDLDWRGPRIAGVIELPGRPARPFRGYVELIAALEGTKEQAEGCGSAPLPAGPNDLQRESRG